MKSQTFSLWDTYKERCETEGVKTKKKAFRKAESAMQKTCAALHKNEKTLFLQREIDDTFSYVVVLEGDIAYPEIMRKEDAQARITCIRSKSKSTDNP